MLFERKHIFELLSCLRSVIIQEGSYSLDFNEQILNAFLFEKLETSDPLRLDSHSSADHPQQPILGLRFAHASSNDKLFFSSSELFQRFLSFLLHSVNE